MSVSNLVNVRIPLAVRKELQNISKREHVPISNLIRDSLREFLAVRRFKRWQKDVSRFARKAGYISEDDILKMGS